MSRRTTRSLNCISCNEPVRDVGDRAIGVLCPRCTGSEDGWQRYNEWKRAQEQPRRQRVKKEPDKLDLQIAALEKAIRELEK